MHMKFSEDQSDSAIKLLDSLVGYSLHDISRSLLQLCVSSVGTWKW